ncbi:amino acid ABC transporter permease [Corynebacterium pseudotuberculosis]|uniref:ABC transporter permease subunit n=3 Tax=Corynebacterium pseudotuberculosis TaxID=1719 RepID=D9Q9A6_CORP2|nr:amino acid ABC transporter permease [Corynebacterium pseudotuberculosis]ADL10132.1 ABC transporter permease subunit [Corynebacterium pseudotuberculosis C231]ADO25924.1 ABC transporter permease subunit [Corynebacterium pseudotuberculosis I19]AEP69906.1 Glutamate transport system permease protein gluD [Corynebacterium pseudotuberculosis 42/02-A]AEQ06207.1 ABC transporter permease subunit [Corynebacterium pseudotuberculosis CIP 52.97]AFF21805.1 Glutamate transport system permease protein gluD 
MSVRATVLYDAPGPNALRRNALYTVLTVIVAIALIGWVLVALHSKGQLDAVKWAPFIDPRTWNTYLLPGLVGTLKSAFSSVILAIILGVLLGLGRLSRRRSLRWICAAITEFFRAVPVLLLIIFSYQALAMYKVVPPRELAFTAVVFSLTMYNGAVIAEILRAGIRALPRGQTEAAQALGLGHWQTMQKILLPQAVAAMLPALIAQAVIALKDSALGYQIGYVEIVRQGIQSSATNRNYLPSLIVVAILMILINYSLTVLAERVERQLRAGRARRNILAKVPEHPHQGLTTKDNAYADWHDPGHQEIKNPAE